ncbi:hypothetical protein MUK42_28848 [Musa troglodytarum]|uniref:Uncharacterized protein n=1 Tax=Musa troglodytarum TaxID=320322 RepID=A0A9E7FHJ3_9LILI|nr:hypothetical protein MUK42_28848 [Musa troglodytarum]
MCQLYIKWCRQQQAENTKKNTPRQLRVGFLISKMTDSIDRNDACMGSQHRKEGRKLIDDMVVGSAKSRTGFGLV